MKNKKQFIGMALIAMIALVFIACPMLEEPDPTYTIIMKEFYSDNDFRSTFGGIIGINNIDLTNPNITYILPITKTDRNKFTDGTTRSGITYSEVEEILKSYQTADKNNILATLKANGGVALAGKVINGYNEYVLVIGFFEE